MRTLNELTGLAKAIRAAPRDVRTLLDLTGLDPVSDFRNLNLRNVDFSHCDLTGFNFTGTSLLGCRFTGARIAGAVFDAHHRAHATIFRDAIDRPRFPSVAAHFVIGGDNTIEFVPTPGVENEQRAIVAGTALHCALACAGLGTPTSFLGSISLDSYGDRIRSMLEEAGAEVLLREGIDAPTSQTVVTFEDTGNANLRYSAGADQVIDQDSLIAALPDTASALCVNGLVICNHATAHPWISLVQKVAADGVLVAIDPQVRRTHADDLVAYRRTLSDLMRFTDIWKLSQDDLLALYPEWSPEAFSEQALKAGARLIVITNGDRDSLAFIKHAGVRIAAFKPEQLADTVGVGSAFMAGLLTGLARIGLTRSRHLDELTEDTLRDVLHYATVVAGLTCGKSGFYPPTQEEVRDSLADA